MERSRIIAIACAIIAAVCVIIAGKSCADDAIENGKKSGFANKGTSAQNARHTVEVRGNDGVTTETYALDLFGNRVYETTTTEPVEYDLFGRPVTTAPPETETTAVVTDENGEVIEVTDTSEDTTDTTDTTDTSDTTDPEETASDEAPEETAPASTAPPKISGFHHGDYDDEGNPKPTLPPDFAIIIR
ncbi:MAG: hypothetical protein Q4A05_06075 [Ruminococcus sp.]|nr:hypothetical protein [Ruminococcus sp.]